MVYQKGQKRRPFGLAGLVSGLGSSEGPGPLSCALLQIPHPKTSCRQPRRHNLPSSEAAWTTGDNCKYEQG